MEKLLKAIRSFTGIKIVPLKIQACNADGYGIAVLTITFYSKKVVTVARDYSLFFFNFFMKHKKRGKRLELRAGILFFNGLVWSKIIKPEQDFCLNCDTYCETKEFYKDGQPYCCEWCQPKI